MMTNHPLSRRSTLKAGIAVTLGTLAGCTGKADPTSGSSNTSSVKGSVFDSISFDDQDLVVQLHNDHDVSHVNLIAPDGTLFKQTSVAEGARTVRLQILDIKPLSGSYEHYTPGPHDLVGVREGDNEVLELDLKPNLRITEVRQYRGGDKPRNYAQLAVDVENTGSAPTWVHFVTYRDAPNYTADDEVGGDPGVILLDVPSKPTDSIIYPNEIQTYIGPSHPLLYRNQKNPTCRSEEEFTVLVEIAVGEPLRQRIRAVTGGEPLSVGLLNEYVCNDISIEEIGDG